MNMAGTILISLLVAVIVFFSIVIRTENAVLKAAARKCHPYAVEPGCALHAACVCENGTIVWPAPKTEKVEHERDSM